MPARRESSERSEFVPTGASQNVLNFPRGENFRTFEIPSRSLAQLAATPTDMEALVRPPTSASIAGGILSEDIAAGAAAASVDAAPPADSATPVTTGTARRPCLGAG